jgi:hypothetical protein
VLGVLSLIEDATPARVAAVLGHGIADVETIFADLERYGLVGGQRQ